MPYAMTLFYLLHLLVVSTTTFRIIELRNKWTALPVSDIVEQSAIFICFDAVSGGRAG